MQSERHWKHELVETKVDWHGSSSCCFPACYFSVHNQNVTRSSKGTSGVGRRSSGKHVAGCSMPLRCVCVCWMGNRTDKQVQREHLGQRKPRALMNELKCPSEPRSPLPEWVKTHVPEEPVVLDGEEFVSLCSSRRGAAPGPSGMCLAHLCLLVDRETDEMTLTMLPSRNRKAEACGAWQQALHFALRFAELSPSVWPGNSGRR